MSLLSSPGFCYKPKARPWCFYVERRHLVMVSEKKCFHLSINTPTRIMPVLARFISNNLHQPIACLGRCGDPRPWRFEHANLRIRTSCVTIPPFERLGLLLSPLHSPLNTVIKKFGDLHDNRAEVVNVGQHSEV